MDNEIDRQINLFNKKFSIKKIGKKVKNNNYVFKVTIKNNKLICKTDKYKLLLDKDFYPRIEKIKNILLILLSLYEIKDTTFYINVSDNYLDERIPVFNLTLPFGKKGLIFPNYDMYWFFHSGANFNHTIKEFEQFNPNKIINCIYFKGGRTTEIYSKIREKLSNEKFPFRVNAVWGKNEPIYYVKKYKYLLDLPGGKPWSIRLKYLALSERLIIRVSFYNSKLGETDYWNQFTDIFIKENIDYIHLKYDLDYDSEISNTLYTKIKTDILEVYNFFEKNPNLYKRMVDNLKIHSSELNLENMYKYLYKLINKYTDNLIITV